MLFYGLNTSFCKRINQERKKIGALNVKIKHYNAILSCYRWVGFNLALTDSDICELHELTVTPYQKKINIFFFYLRIFYSYSSVLHSNLMYSIESTLINFSNHVTYKVKQNLNIYGDNNKLYSSDGLNVSFIKQIESF